MPDPSTDTIILHRLNDLVAKLGEFIVETRTTYVRQDVQAPILKGITDDIEDVRKDVKSTNDRLDKAEAFKRQILAGSAVGVIILVINLFIALNNFMARGGS